MKSFILIAALLMGGCATVDHNGDTPRQADIRVWVTAEVVRIYQKQNKAREMRDAGQITEGEYQLLMRSYEHEKHTIPSRAPF